MWYEYLTEPYLPHCTVTAGLEDNCYALKISPIMLGEKSDRT